MSARTIDRRVATGRWRRLYPGIYVPSSVAIAWRQQLAGACLACGDNAFASHRSALAVWTFADDLFVPEVTLPIDVRRGVPGVTAHRTEVIERCRHNGFAVTTPMRTLLDGAGCVSESRVNRFVDDALRRRLVHLETFQAYIDRPEHRSRPGSKALRKALALRLPGRAIGSDAETVFFDLLRDCGLPLPVPQFEVATKRGPRFIDFFFPDAGLAIEIDGYEKYSTRAALDDERARQNELELLGHRFLRFTWTQITDEAVDVGITVGLRLGLRPSRWKRR